MKRFTFTLETLLDMRKREEEQIMRQLADKNRAILLRKKDLEAVCQQLKNLQTSEKTGRAETKSAQLLRYGVSYRYKLKADILKIGRQIDDLQAEAFTIGKKLTKATQARKALEKVRERKKTEWKQAADRKEQQFIDDIAQQRYIAHER